MNYDAFEVETYRPFIDDNAHLAELDGQRFVVLRPPAAIAEPYQRIQEQLRSKLAGLPVSHPATPHVTLCGFTAGTSLPSVQRLVDAWARDTSRLTLEIAAVSTFPPPFQIVFVEVQRTPPLFSALQRIRALADESALVVSTKLPVEEWRFHMTLAYCSKLGETEWREAERFARTVQIETAAAEVGVVEVVAFDAGQEYSGGRFSLGGANLEAKE